MKLEVGMYVRTKHYGIFKILKIIKEKDKLWFLRNPGHQVFISDKNNPIEEEIIGNPSYDILDLIEKDDVVAYYNSLQDIKGLIIERVQDNNYIKRLIEFVQIGTINIVRVMTKEQFEQYSYKIGE